MNAPAGPFERFRADEFPQLERMTYLNTAAESAFMRSHADALQQYAGAKSLGTAGREGMYEIERDCRRRAAALLEVSPREIAFVASAAHAVNAVIGAIDWRRGDAVVLTDLEFPTNAFAARRLAEAHGVDVRVVRADAGRGALDRIVAAVDSRTQLVIASEVGFDTGFRIDVDALADAAHDAGAMLLVDATQAAGAIPVSGLNADFVVAATYKWLLGSHGLAVLSVNERRAGLAPAYVGWKGVEDAFAPDRFERYVLAPDARRFEAGMPNMPSIFVLRDALERISRLGIDEIERHNAALASLLLEGFRTLGLEPLTPDDPAQRAGIVVAPLTDSEQLVAALADGGVHVWGRAGRLRASVHAYSTAGDVERLIAACRPLLRSLRSVGAGAASGRPVAVRDA